ncbi:retinol dehydrogenase 12-like [Patiria miniata]|uniref:Retinol dehydrogenase 13 n=1 Tax=Patiria miniata TaxID=46514 RepID=A0A914AC04_PATMI|nr:retinol dehydrogenase 12-like [Patiria miniata]XP_038062076.1 retinol dehydrogenase 12-like [Patiria miniata]
MNKLDIFGRSVDPAIAASVVVGVVVVLWLVRRWVAGGWCYSNARLDGKTVVITGANSGIGKETAKDMARRGARVIIACRDLPKAEAAASEIRTATGNNKVTVRKLDLASLASVRECAKKIKAEVKKLDILINNAGIMMCPPLKTEDGFEMQLGVNHLGHFLLTNLLLDLIKSSAPARIVNVSSLAHDFNNAKMFWDDINLEKNYDPMVAYGQSKLANVLFTVELAKRLKGTQVTANSLHPGTIETELTRHTQQAICAMSLPWRIFFRIIMCSPIGNFFRKTAVQGAQTTIHLAVSEELKNTTGQYYSDCVPAKTNKQYVNSENARRLWEMSAEMVGLDKKVD